MKAYVAYFHDRDDVLILGVFRSHTDAVDVSQKRSGQALEWSGTSNYIFSVTDDGCYAVKVVQVK